MNFSSTGTSNLKFSGPPPVHSLSPKDLIREHFYLSKFLEQLEKAANIPTLPDTQSLQNLIQMNADLEENAKAFRECFYEQYLQKKLHRLQLEYEQSKKRLQKTL